MSFTDDDYMSLFPTSFITKGYARTTIINTSERKVYFVSNKTDELISNFKRISIFDLLHKNKNVYQLVQFLVNNNLGMVVKKSDKERFLPIVRKVEIPFLFNSIVDVDKVNINKIKLTLNKLNDVKISNIQVRFLGNIEKEDFLCILEELKKYSFYSIELVMKSNLFLSLSKSDVLTIDKEELITKVFVSGNIDKQFKEGIKFIFTNAPLNEENICGNISMKYFSPFLESVIYSKHSNTCLNCKISVDKYGKIKNCPSMKESFGDIKDVSIKEVLKNPNFQKFDKITKDEINVCKDCEFRYICTDCRAYIDNPNDIYSRPSKCNYNPYICKWEGEEGFQTLEECGVISNEKGFSIDHEKIAAINNMLWEEEKEDA